MDFVDHKLKNIPKEEIDVKEIMCQLQSLNRPIRLTDINKKDYRKILFKAISMGISTKELLKCYGIDYSGKNKDRLSKAYLSKMPYLDEMKKRRDLLLVDRNVTVENGYCKEEVFEERIKVCKQVYDEFKDKIYNFVPDLIDEKEKV